MSSAGDRESPAAAPADRRGARLGTSVESDGQTWSVAEPEAVLTLDPATAAELAEAARRLAAEDADKDDIDDYDLLVRAEVSLRRASPELIAALVRFRLTGTRDGAMLLRGLPLDDPLPPTPASGEFRGSWRELTLCTCTQLMVMSVLGDVISYADEKSGRLIQDVCPIRGAEARQENNGSCLLELHTEDGFHPSMPHFISLLTLRADHGAEAVTAAAGIRAILPALDPDHVRALREPWYRMRLASSFVGSERAVYSEAMPVLKGSEGDPDLCVDFHASEPINDEARAALDELRRAILGALVGTRLRPGDMLIVDNRKAVHGRTGFTPRYDGRDRWLRRCFAVADIRASHRLLFPASRVHRPLADSGLIPT
jgi:L-asparagine oxygenase